jgi:hygromycin-B 7''-O-kinase
MLFVLGTSTSSGLALARARRALGGAGLDPATPLRRVSSVSNEVWLTEDAVIRVNRRADHRLSREAALAPHLPPEVGYPEVIASGCGDGYDWLVTRRLQGLVLSRCWPGLSPVERRTAVNQLGRALAALHSTTAPTDLEPIAGPQGLREHGGGPAVGPLLERLDRARCLAHVDRGLVHDLAAYVTATAPVLEPFDSETLVHGDVTFENVLWDGERITALLDFEYARVAPADLDLDVLLRFCSFPFLHVAEDYEADTLAADYVSVPWWLNEVYPTLFAFPHQLERIRLYAIGFDVARLLEEPPVAPAAQLSPHHPLNRLISLARHRSYLDRYRTH